MILLFSWPLNERRFLQSFFNMKNPKMSPNRSGLALLLALMFVHQASAFPDGLLKRPDDWFRSAEGKAAVSNVISWQAESGSWPKNHDHSHERFSGKKPTTGTFDNGSTTAELRFLARAFEVTGNIACRDSFLLGFDHILKAQFPNGGWPQYFPLSKQYHRHITFNDHSMVRILEFLREVTHQKRYDFVGQERRAAASKSFSRGIDCILKCQYLKDGKPSAWCAQHHEITLRPAAARSYELESLSGSESSAILKLLMSIENPSPEIVRAVKAGVEWFDDTKITGLRIEKIDGVRTAVTDSSDPAIWARFYDLETGKPFFCDRDGIKKWNYHEISKERRNGYAWYGNWGESVLKNYAKWSYR
jgi:PelA/Pel-15E family pectate lyase